MEVGTYVICGLVDFLPGYPRVPLSRWPALASLYSTAIPLRPRR
jgi:hypothetical protein